MAYPQLVLDNNTRAIIKLFSPELGIVLVDGYDVKKGTVLTTVVDHKELPYDIYKRYDNDALDEEYARKMIEE